MLFSSVCSCTIAGNGSQDPRHGPCLCKFLQLLMVLLLPALQLPSLSHPGGKSWLPAREDAPARAPAGAARQPCGSPGNVASWKGGWTWTWTSQVVAPPPPGPHARLGPRLRMTLRGSPFWCHLAPHSTPLLVAAPFARFLTTVTCRAGAALQSFHRVGASLQLRFCTSGPYTNGSLTFWVLANLWSPWWSQAGISSIRVLCC